MNQKRKKIIKGLSILGMVSLSFLIYSSYSEIVEAAKSSPHIGTFEGSTTITTSSSNGINPGLFIEVKDEYGNLTQYESEEGRLTIPNTKEGAYITQAKLLGKTKYRDQDTGEILDQWEEGRNLKLESAKNPVVHEIGGNLFPNLTEYDVLLMKTEGVDYELTENRITWKNVAGYSPSVGYFFDLKPNTKYSFSYVAEGNPEFLAFDRHSIDYDAKHVLVAEYSKNNGRITYTFTAPSNGKVAIRLANYNKTEAFAYMEDCYLTETATNSSQVYRPKQTNVLTLSEGLELRGFGDVRDTLDLINEEVVFAVGETALTRKNHWIANERFQANGYLAFYCIDIPNKAYGRLNLISDTFKVSNQALGEATLKPMDIMFGEWETPYVYVQLNAIYCESPNESGFKKYLDAHPITIQYELDQVANKRVRLTSTYLFKAINGQSVKVNGGVSSTIVSITLPDTSLSFLLNPNEEKGKQFIAPEFEVSNDTLAPLHLALRTFEQTTMMLNDVSPTTYANWEGLNKTESRDIALALVPIPSEGWLSLIEGNRFVADKTNYELGTIKAKSTVKFTFNAFHGHAFETIINPNYRLTFIFDFLN